MKKSIIFGGSILCLFILVSLSYQPIIADVNVNQLKAVKNLRFLDIDIEEYIILHKDLIENNIDYRTLFEDDCGCKTNTENRYPTILCAVLWIIAHITFEILYSLINDFNIDERFLYPLIWIWDIYFDWMLEYCDIDFPFITFNLELTEISD